MTKSTIHESEIEQVKHEMGWDCDFHVQLHLHPKVPRLRLDSNANPEENESKNNIIIKHSFSHAKFLAKQINNFTKRRFKIPTTQNPKKLKNLSV